MARERALAAQGQRLGPVAALVGHILRHGQGDQTHRHALWPQPEWKIQDRAKAHAGRQIERLAGLRIVGINVVAMTGEEKRAAVGHLGHERGDQVAQVAEDQVARPA